MYMNNTRILKARRPRSGPAALLVPLALLFGACNQNAIFYNISQEVEIREATIKGTPTNIVEWKNKLYAANFEGLYCYADPAGGNSSPVWNAVPSPGGQIRGLAATGGNLYVLTSDGLYIKTDSGWDEAVIDESDEEAKNYPFFQNIYADTERLFVGSGSGYFSAGSADYAILYTTDDTGKKLGALKTGVGLLSGAAFNGSVHFVSTLQGVFTAAEPADSTPLAAAGPVGDDAGRAITGIICLEDNAKTIVAIERGGALLKVTPAGYADPDIKITRSTRTGALAIWRTPPSDPDNPGDPDAAHPRLLLAGLQGSITSTSQSYVNGYREIALDPDTGGLIDGTAPQTPGEGDSSISNRPKYESSLGILVVNYLFQAPYRIDKNMTLFAAVAGEQGLWSYRDHGDGEVNWNAESE
jgi:hypothetical protein